MFRQPKTWYSYRPKVREAILGVLLGAFTPAIATAQEDVLESVLAAWKRREAITTSVVFEWTQSDKIRVPVQDPKGVIGRGGKKPGEFIDATLDCSLRLDGERFDIRLSTRNGAALSLPIGARSAYDGQSSQDYSGDRGPGTVGGGIISSQPHEFGTQLLYAKALLLIYRPLHLTMGKIRQDRLALKSDTELIGGARCHVLIDSTEDPPYVKQYSVDPTSGFVIRRYREYIDGRECLRMDLTYRRDPVHGFIPSHWKSIVMFSDDGAVTDISEATVDKSSINVAIPIGDFRILFPKGTKVEDRRTMPGVKTVSSGGSVENQFALKPESNRRPTALAIGNSVLFGGLLVAALIWHKRRTKRHARILS